MSSPLSLQQLIHSRDGDEAVKDLHNCLIVMNTVAQVLAEMFPGCTAMLGIANGAPCATLAFARSRHGNHFTVGTMAAAQSLAKLTASLPSELQAPYEIELRLAREKRELEAQREAARAAALKVASEGRH